MSNHVIILHHLIEYFYMISSETYNICLCNTRRRRKNSRFYNTNNILYNLIIIYFTINEREGFLFIYLFLSEINYLRAGIIPVRTKLVQNCDTHGQLTSGSVY